MRKPGTPIGALKVGYNANLHVRKFVEDWSDAWYESSMPDDLEGLGGNWWLGEK